MPIRTSSMAKKIAANGQALHRAMMQRMEAGDAEPSAAETELIEARRSLKQQREQRKEQALQPRPTALDKLVRTHHSQPKEKPKAGKDAEHAKEAKKPKARRTRAEKHAEQAAAVEAARNRPKQQKPATK